MKNIALLVSLLAAVAGGFLLWIYKQRFEAEVSGGPKVAIAVAAADMNLGDRLDAEKVTTRIVPQAYVERRNIRASEAKEVLGTRVRTEVRTGEAILWTDLATSGPNSRDLAGLVLPGMRAMAIPAGKALTFDGLLRPGDRIDILLTTVNLETEEVKTLPLLQNIIVLAIGAHLGTVTSSPGKEFSFSTVSVSVKPEQAQILVNAMRKGRFNIVLRNTEDIRILEYNKPKAGAESIAAPK